MQRALRTLESRHQILERNSGSPRGQDGVELEDAIEFVHKLAYSARPSHDGVYRDSLVQLRDNIRAFSNDSHSEYARPVKSLSLSRHGGYIHRGTKNPEALDVRIVCTVDRDPIHLAGTKEFIRFWGNFAGAALRSSGQYVSPISSPLGSRHLIRSVAAASPRRSCSRPRWSNLCCAPFH